jgi:GAF domain-containing protein
VPYRGFKVPSPRAESELQLASPAAAFAPAEKQDRIFDILAERALQETGATSVAIGLMGDGGVTCRATAGRPITAVGDPINHETGLTGLAFRRQMSQWCSDTESDTRVNLEACRQLGLRSIMVVPVSVQDAVVGVFAIFSGNPDAFSLAHLNAVKKLSHWISEAAEHAILKTPPATIAPAVGDRKHSDQTPPTIFNSASTQESSLRHYTARIWRAMARVLPGGQRGHAS